MYKNKVILGKIKSIPPIPYSVIPVDYFQNNTSIIHFTTDEIFNNIPHFIKKKHLHFDWLQDGFVMYKNKLILGKRKVIPPIPDSMIPVDYCQHNTSIIHFTNDDITSKFEFFSKNKNNNLYLTESMWIDWPQMLDEYCGLFLVECRSDEDFMLYDRHELLVELAMRHFKLPCLDCLNGCRNEFSPQMFYFWLKIMWGRKAIIPHGWNLPGGHIITVVGRWGLLPVGYERWLW